MKNRILPLVMALSVLMLPTIVSARLTNETITHNGLLAIQDANSIILSQHAGKSITLNKGALDIKTTKISMGFSLLDPQLVIKQNGQTMYIDVNTLGYAADQESFNLKASDSDLNYDLFFKKITTSSKDVQSIQTGICTYKQFGTKCGVDLEGKYNCISGLQNRAGVQQVKNTNIEVTDTYNLIFSRRDIVKAVFTSTKTTKVLKKSEALSVCQ